MGKIQRGDAHMTIEGAVIIEKGVTFAIIHQIRLIDAYSKGVDANIPTSQLYSELVSRILAA